MRILFLVDGYFPGVGGAEIQATLLARTLMQRGHEVTIVVPHLLDHLPLLDSCEGVPVQRIAYFHVPKLSNVFYMISFAWFLLKSGRNYDAYHIHMVHKMAAVVAVLRPWLGGPVLAKVSGATEFEGGVLDASRPTFYRRWVQKLLTRLDYFQALSSYSRTQIMAAGVQEQQVIELANGLDISRFKLSESLHGGTDDEISTLAYCGRLAQVKALPVLLHAIKKVKNQTNSKFVLRLAGDGSIREELEGLCESLGIADCVEFCGRISDVPAFFAKAHVYVQVSRYEGLSNSVLEAMCSGLAPVLTRISGNEDLVEHAESGYLIDVDDVEALAEHLCTLLQDRALCRQVGLQARARVESLCALDHVVDTLERVYEGSYARPLTNDVRPEPR